MKTKKTKRAFAGPQAHKVMISVDKAMRERMTRFQRVHTVNWSLLARQAFEEHMNQEERR